MAIFQIGKEKREKNGNSKGKLTISQKLEATLKF